nr:reverse transcriptase domain-containing protein [Tanacetum cinerariifolium]
SCHKITEPLRIEFHSQEDQFQEDPPVATMTDNHTMAKMLRAPTEGESFHEEWDRYKDLLRACPHHGFTELHQLNTFYNALNPTDQDSLNAAAGGNSLERSTQDVITIIKNKSKVRNSQSKSISSQVKTCDTNSSSEIAKLTHAVNEQTSAVTTAMTAMLRQFQATPPPASVKAVEETCVTCGGAHSYYQCLAAGGNTFPEFRDNILEYGSAAAANYNQVANPKSNLNAITTRSGVSYDGPSISPPVVENAPEATKDTVIPTNNGNTEDVQPQAVSSKPPVSTSEPANTPVSASKPNLKASIPYPSRRNDERNQEKAKDQIEKFYQLFKDMSFEISFTDALILMPKTFLKTERALIDVFEGDNKFPVIIAKELGDEEKAALIKVLKSHKRAIAWKLSDIQGINPEFCTHKILMEEDSKPAVQN